MEQPFSKDLENTIDDIVKKVKHEQEKAKYGEKSLYESSESTVEHQIIGPIIVSLGWDLTDPEQVTTKYWKLRDNTVDKPDFVLYEYDRPVIVIEAKALGKTGGQDNVIQILKYLRYCPNVFLTDGIVWSCYSESAMGFSIRQLPFGDPEWDPTFKREILPKVKPVWEFDLLKHNREYCLMLLSSISREGLDMNMDYEKRIQEAYYRVNARTSAFIDEVLEEMIMELDLMEIVRNRIIYSLAEHFRVRLEHKILPETIENRLDLDFEDDLKRYVHRNIGKVIEDSDIEL